MTIEIDTTRGRPPLSTAETGQSGRVGSRPDDTSAKGTTTGTRTDTVNLTDRAARLQRLEAQIESQPVVDARRVAEIQRALATGSFEIRPAQVADKLLQFEAGLNKPG